MAQAIIGLYAPLDGMNEDGFAVSVNMIEDSDTIEQDTDKPDITTTTAIRLLLDQAANVEEAAWNHILLGMIRAALWNMTMPQILSLLAKRLRIVYIAATDGRYGGAMAVGAGIDGVGASQMYLDIKTPLDEWIRQIKEFKPNIIIGYPSAIKILAELVEKGRVEVNAARVVSCGEPLGASLRNYLERSFQTKVVNFYGASESLTLGVEMNPEDGMILFDDMNFIEVESGVMYLTCLYNFAQPLVTAVEENPVLEGWGNKIVQSAQP